MLKMFQILWQIVLVNHRLTDDVSFLLIGNKPECKKILVGAILKALRWNKSWNKKKVEMGSAAMTNLGVMQRKSVSQDKNPTLRIHWQIYAEDAS